MFSAHNNLGHEAQTDRCRLITAFWQQAELSFLIFLMSLYYPKVSRQQCAGEIVHNGHNSGEAGTSRHSRLLATEFGKAF
jgi:hypothetical protein